MSDLAEVRADLEWVMAYWPDLVDARLPMATKRPWRQTELTLEARAEQDAQARLERIDRTALSLGESPAPVDVVILSAVLDLLVRADDLAAAVAEHAGLPVLPAPRPGELDAWPYLAYAAAHLDEDLAEWAAPIARRMYEQTASALAMIHDGQTLDVVCPWCSTTAVWRVQELPGGIVAIVCHGECEPPLNEVGTWWGGRPVWPITDWERLAHHVQAAEKRSRETVARGKMAS
ncbi:hypothetical protein GCM10017673_14720 [Streptosporangium violaceochromogenes]|nr:hypothetical protein GCM10017673_14720 [Streptosporangium violaceochromogenes]